MTRARDLANLIGSGNYSSTTFTATAGQTAFTISHTQGFVQVFMNGLLLDETVDYTSNGTAITLTSGAAAGDEIEVVAYNTFSVGDAQTQAQADTRYVNTSGDSMTGNLGVNVSPTAALDVRRSDADGKIAEFHQNSGYGFELSSSQTEARFRSGYLQAMSITTDPGSGAVERIRISKEGRVTMPYQPSFGAYQGTANYTLGSGWAKLIADGTRWNEGNHYSTANSRFTAPIAGVYHFSAHVNCYSINDDELLGVAFRVNGSSHTMGSRFYSRGQADIVASMSHTIKLDATDYVEVWNYSNDASHGFSSGATWNTFSGFLVG